MPPHEPAEIPLCFTSFVAERRGLALDAGAALVASWLAQYEPGPDARTKGHFTASGGHRQARAA